jgi:hypothetical protein
VEPAPVATTRDGATPSLTRGGRPSLKTARIVHDSGDRAPNSECPPRGDLTMTDRPIPPAQIPRVEELFKHIPHPRIAQRKAEKPVKVDDERVGANGRVALIITAVVGTMWCAYIFTIIALISLPSALSSGQAIVIIAWIAQTFLQLVLLPIIIVGQNIQGKAADKRSEQTYKDAEAILSECLQLQAHLQAQDTVLDDVVAHVKEHHEELQKLSARVGPATA